MGGGVLQRMDGLVVAGMLLILLMAVGLAHTRSAAQLSKTHIAISINITNIMNTLLNNLGQNKVYSFWKISNF